MSILSETLVTNILSSESNGEDFPVNFDDVWEAAGYSRKNNALRVLSQYFESGVDYTLLSTSTYNRSLNSEQPASNGGFSHLMGSTPATYCMTVDTVKSFFLVANTAEGREARRYFIAAEKQYRKQLERQFDAPAVTADYALIGNLYAEVERLKTDNEALMQWKNAVTETAQIKVWKPCKDKFSVPLTAANDVIGYASLPYLINVLRKEFVRDKDFEVDGLKQYHLTEACFHELVIVARPQRGARLDCIPEILIVERDRMFRSAEERMNRCFGHEYNH
jgi:phage anti-repressor protein